MVILVILAFIGEFSLAVMLNFIVSVNLVGVGYNSFSLFVLYSVTRYSMHSFSMQVQLILQNGSCSHQDSEEVFTPGD